MAKERISFYDNLKFILILLNTKKLYKLQQKVYSFAFFVYN